MKKISIRNAIPSDLQAVTSLDHVTTKDSKPEYWREIFSHYINGTRKDRFFIVAETDVDVIGFIVGEIRAWEFGSPPCGWVFALAVSPNARETGIGKRMFDEISTRMKQTGVATVRTMTDRDDRPLVSFFRSMGLRTGKSIELEMQLD